MAPNQNASIKISALVPYAVFVVGLAVTFGAVKVTVEETTRLSRQNQEAIRILERKVDVLDARLDNLQQSINVMRDDLNEIRRRVLEYRKEFQGGTQEN